MGDDESRDPPFDRLADSSAITAAPRSSSSEAVGSSASRTAGSVHQRAGDADPLALAARELCRSGREPPFEADGPEQFPGPGRAGERRADRAMWATSSTCSTAVREGNRFADWNTMPIVGRGAGRVGTCARPVGVGAVDRHRSARRPAEEAGDREQRRLPEPGRAGDGDDLAGVDGESTGRRGW